MSTYKVKMWMQEPMTVEADSVTVENGALLFHRYEKLRDEHWLQCKTVLTRGFAPNEWQTFWRDT